MQKKSFIIFILIYFSLSLHGQEFSTKELSKNKIWLKLLYYNQEHKISEVVSPNYFLAQDGNINPESELNATLEAYFNAPKNLSDTDAICKYPARYMWISKYIKLPKYKIINPQCKRLNKAIQSLNVDSFSLMFVSGYLGNPASAFGHSFLKINTDNKNTNLFDISLSYGAQVPDNENAFMYILNGLFGGYDAAYTDKYFYTNDLVYTQSELRDIWEYRLNLSDEKKLFLFLHIYEIQRKNFRYFFLNKNCAYAIAKILELVIEKPLVTHAKIWYAPIESFHNLSEINDENNQTLITDIIFHPSAQKQLYKKYKQLNQLEKNVTSILIGNDLNYSSEEYLELDTSNKQNVVNFTLSYYKYVMIQDINNTKVKKLKNKALVQRLRLPMQKEKQLKHEIKQTPDQNNKPITLTAVTNYDKYLGSYQSIGLSLFTLESIGQNNLNGNELVLFNTFFGFNAKKYKYFIDHFELIKIKKFKLEEMPFDAESKISWDFQIGIQHTKELKYDYYTQGSLGKSWLINKKIILFALSDFSLHTKDAHFRVLPKIGARFDFTRLKSLIYLGYETNFEKRPFYTYVKIDAAYSIYKKISLLVQYEKNKNTKFSGGLQYFF